MSPTAFSELSAVVLGTIAGSFLATFVIACIYAVFRNKSHTKEEFRYHRNKAMFGVYWWYLFIGIMVNYARGNIKVDLTAIYGWTFSISIISYLVYRYAKKALNNRKESSKNPASHQYEPNQTVRINHEDETSPKPDLEKLESHTTNLSESEEYWGLISFAYGKIKQTNVFKLWRREQFDCQFGKCAICGKPMEIRFAQVDHIKPRFRKGTNYSNNLALVHKDCNMKKGAKTGFEKPTWMKDNKFSEKLDEKVYEITEEIRVEYPTKFPDELFTKPTRQA